MFKTDGVLRLVSLPAMPMLKATVSAKANLGIWQLAQLTEESLESIFSENNFLPREALVLMSVFSFSKKELITTIVKTAVKKDKTVFFINPNLLPAVVKSLSTYKLLFVPYKKIIFYGKQRSIYTGH